MLSSLKLIGKNKKNDWFIINNQILDAGHNRKL